MSKRLVISGCALVAVSVIFGYHAYHETVLKFTDWIAFEVGARVLVHYHHQGIYADPRLHVYVDNRDLQIGPPALWLVAAFEWLSVRRVIELFCIVMPSLGVMGIVALTRTAARRYTNERPKITRLALQDGAMLLVGGLLAYDLNVWRHLDDIMALSFFAVAMLLISRGKAWWLVGLLAGTAVATKPWAIILTPVLLGMARRDLARTALLTVAVAGAWWAPFIIAAPGTLQALGHFPIVPHAGSVLYLIGIHGHVERWLHPVQFLLGIAVGCYVAQRRGWTMAPLAALAVRVLTDPYAYPYYGMGPLLFSYFYDLERPVRWNIPVLTIVAAGCEYGIPQAHMSPTLVALAKVGWAVAALAMIALRRVPSGESLAAEAPAPESDGLAAPAAA